MAMMVLHDVYGVFVDALLTDDAEGLVFLSIWGRDTAIRELQARITIGSSEGGLTSLTVIEACPEGSRKHLVRLTSVDLIEQLTGRVRKNVLGEIVHCWLFHRDVIKPDKANYRALLVNRENQFDNLWDYIKLICPIPLLNHWKAQVLPLLEAENMISRIEGIGQYGVKISLDEDHVARMIKRLCILDQLSLTET